MVMGEDISRLMDGELPDAEFEACVRRLQQSDGLTTWVCYHVIGDALRGSGLQIPGFKHRFAARLAVEPTVLSPRPRRANALPMAWAAAATLAAIVVVGWVAVSTLEVPAAALAQAREAGAVRAAQLRPPAVPADYLLAHQEYAPTVQIQGVDPNFRTVSASTSEPRP
jgi:sigma-E factor negative regulatory protein RseA